MTIKKVLNRLTPSKEEKRYTLEICADSVESGIIAERAGADRVELCSNLVLGGTTPSYGCIKQAREKLNIPIHVLIRPRSGDFCYTDEEFAQIREDIEIAKNLGVNGIVCGLLRPDGTVDIKRTAKLVELAGPLSFTFHRAFDFTPDPFEALESIINTGASHLLTSGQQKKAVEGIELIERLVGIAKNRITLIAGSGINPSNIEQLLKTGVTQFHMSASNATCGPMLYRKKELTLTGNSIDEYSILQTDFVTVKEAIKRLTEY